MSNKAKKSLANVNKMLANARKTQEKQERKARIEQQIKNLQLQIRQALKLGNVQEADILSDRIKNLRTSL